MKKKITNILYYILAAVLMLSSISKIIYPQKTLVAMETLLNIKYGEALLTVILVLFELIMAVILIKKIAIKITLQLCIIMTSLFFLVSIYGVFKGIKVQCGCFGNLYDSTFNYEMIFRNTILLLISVYIYINKTQIIKK